MGALAAAVWTVRFRGRCIRVLNADKRSPGMTGCRVHIGVCVHKNVSESYRGGFDSGKTINTVVSSYVALHSLNGTSHCCHRHCHEAGKWYVLLESHESIQVLSCRLRSSRNTYLSLAGVPPETAKKLRSASPQRLATRSLIQQDLLMHRAERGKHGFSIFLRAPKNCQSGLV